MIWGIINTVLTLGQVATDQAVQVSPTIQASINTIVDLGVKPVASVLISLFALLELFKMSTRADSYGLAGNGAARLEMLGLSLMKIGFIVYFIQNIGNLMWGLYDAGTQVMLSIQNVAGGTGGQISTKYSSLEKVVNFVAEQKYGTMDKLITLIAVLPVLIIVMLCSIAVFVIFAGRIIEIYVLVALAPIPLSTLVHEEYSQIGKNYIKSFCAVVLQGAVIIVILSVYNVMIDSAIVDGSDISAIVWGMAGYGILLVFALAGSSAMAKRVLNAG